mmetsp:Transcript_60773/g.140407  ORF Transcript_60773/g.140407 Transcript_60773/m.140407 type:complete len:434 (-) Transcript_60773:9-1310(-)
MASQEYALQAGTELRVVAAEDGVRIRILQGGAPQAQVGEEMFGAELLPDQDYVLRKGQRGAIYTYFGCVLAVVGKTAQDYVAPNQVMKEYVQCAAILEKRRQRAEDLGNRAPRVLVTGSSQSGKSTLCTMLCNYAVRRERTPVFVELDTRYSSQVQLGGVPGAVSASVIDSTAWDDEPVETISYFFGHVEWTDAPQLFQKVTGMLATLVRRKLSSVVKSDALTQAQRSGVIVNAPAQPSSAVLNHIISAFEIDVVFVLDNDSLHADLKRSYPTTYTGPSVEVVPLQKAGGVVQDHSAKLREYREQRWREYFYGAAGELTPMPQVVKLEDTHIVHLEAAVVPPSFLPHGQGPAAEEDVSAVPYSGPVQHLQHALLAVSSATTLDQVVFAPVLGFVVVTAIDDQIVDLLCPAERLPSIPLFLIVGDVKQVKLVNH